MSNLCILYVMLNIMSISIQIFYDNAKTLKRQCLFSVFSRFIFFYALDPQHPPAVLPYLEKLVRKPPLHYEVARRP